MTGPEKKSTNEEVKDILPTTILRAKAEDVPKDLSFELCTPRETLPEHVKDTVTLITASDKQITNSLIAVFNGPLHKERAGLYSNLVRGELLSQKKSFYHGFDVTEEETRIFFLSEELLNEALNTRSAPPTP